MKKSLIKICLGLFVLILATGCKKEGPEDPNASTYPQLNGTYVYSFVENPDENKPWFTIYEESRWTFDNTRKAEYYDLFWAYTEDGYINKEKTPTIKQMEWKVENGRFYSREWESQDEWKDSYFEYVNDNEVKISNKTYSKAIE